MALFSEEPNIFNEPDESDTSISSVHRRCRTTSVTGGSGKPISDRITCSDHDICNKRSSNQNSSDVFQAHMPDMRACSQGERLCKSPRLDGGELSVHPTRIPRCDSPNGDSALSTTDNFQQQEHKYDEKLNYSGARRFNSFSFNLSVGKYRQLEDKLQKTFNDASFTRFVVGQEETGDAGFRHMQVYIEVYANMSVYAIRHKLDVPFVSGVSGADRSRAIEYATKPETRVDGGIRIRIGTPSKFNLKKVKESSDFFSLALNAPNIQEAVKILEKNEPFHFITKKKTIIESLIQKFGINTKPNFNDFNISKINLYDWKSHVFVGDSGIGKTNFALSHFKNPVHVKHLQMLNRITSNPDSCDGVVFDDLYFNKTKFEEFLCLIDCAFENAVNIKYSVAMIPRGLPRIFCINDISLFYPECISDSCMDAVKRRLKIHYFHNKLFNKYIAEKTMIHPYQSTNV